MFSVHMPIARQKNVQLWNKSAFCVDIQIALSYQEESVSSQLRYFPSSCFLLVWPSGFIYKGKGKAHPRSGHEDGEEK